MCSSQPTPYSSAVSRDSLPPGLEAPVRVSKEKALELYMGIVNKLAENKLQKEAEDERMRSQKQGLKEAVKQWKTLTQETCLTKQSDKYF